jgi:copper chaperone CopZ
VKIAIEGMHSRSCVAKVRRALDNIEGAHVREVQIGSAVVDLDPAHQSAALEAIQKAGYQPHIEA